MSNQLVCNFCGCSEEEVDRIIESADESVAICSDCVGTCVLALEEMENLPPDGL